MFPAPPSPPVAMLEGVPIALLFLAFGYLIVDTVVPTTKLSRSVKLGLAFPALLGYVFVLMLAHMATRGFVFHSPWVVRGITLACAAGLVAVRRRRRREPKELK